MYCMSTSVLVLLGIVFLSVDLHLDFLKDAFTSFLCSSISFGSSKQIFLFSLVCLSLEIAFVGRVASSELCLVSLLIVLLRLNAARALISEPVLTHPNSSWTPKPPSVCWLIQCINCGDDSQTILYGH